MKSRSASGWRCSNLQGNRIRWRSHTAIKQTQKFLQECAIAWQSGGRFPYVITLKYTDAPIGMIEIRVEGCAADIGYALARRYWGLGYMTEAVRTLIAWALQQPDIYRIWAVCDAENAASARVLEKAGM